MCAYKLSNARYEICTHFCSYETVSFKKLWFNPILPKTFKGLYQLSFIKSSLEKGYCIALENMDELALLDQLMLKMKYVHILSFYTFLYIEHLTSL